MWSSERPAPRRRALLAAAAAGSGMLLAGCGFQLRQPARLRFASIALLGFARRSPLEHELARQLRQQVQLLESPDKAEVVLQALDDTRERSVVAQSSAAEIRELQLRVKFSFRARTPGGRELIPRADLLAQRDMSTRETAALAKEHEEAELFRELQADVVAQVLRRLASVTV